MLSSHICLQETEFGIPVATKRHPAILGGRGKCGSRGYRDVANFMDHGAANDG